MTELLVLLTVTLWLCGSIVRGQLQWRRTALDLPLSLIVLLVIIQLAVGNGVFVRWAVAPPSGHVGIAAALPAHLWTTGTVTRGQTFQSLLVLLTYAGVYIVVVQLVNSRRQVDRLVRTLLSFGAVLAFLALIDYITGESWLAAWRDYPFSGRLSGTFVNPDHFATWLVMLVCLSLGYLLARRSSRKEAPSLSDFLLSREHREAALRHHLPLLAIIVMAIAVLFTMSRGGILSLLLTFMMLCAVLAGLRRTRWHIAVLASALIVTLAYASWIGLAPLLARIPTGDVARSALYRSTVPMLMDFPVLGVGLGAYRDIYFRYQPSELLPGHAYYPYAHSDLLQFIVETGLAGTALFGFAVWRTGRDVLSAHVFGRGRCPVGGGHDQWAQRHDPYSIGVALGAMAGVVAALLHGAVEFWARIPANGILAAVLLGLVTVVMHTRFGSEPEHLADTRTWSIPRPRITVPVSLAIIAAAALTIAFHIVRPALADSILRFSGSSVEQAAGSALAVDPGNTAALIVRGGDRLDSATMLWSPVSSTGQAMALLAPVQRLRLSHTLLAGAVTDLRAAIVTTPTDPFVHARLAWAYGMMAQTDPQAPPDSMNRALAHLERAIALSPETAALYGSLAELAASRPDRLLDLGLAASRNAIQREPDWLPRLFERYQSLFLTPAEWTAFAPDDAVNRSRLAMLLDSRGHAGEAQTLYRKALETASARDMVVIDRLLADALRRDRQLARAVDELRSALSRDPDNPELHLGRAEALAAAADPSALDAYRLALSNAEVLLRSGRLTDTPFPGASEALQALLASRFTPADRPLVIRYRRALAQYLTDRRLWEQALPQWNAIVDALPKDAAARYGLGLALAAVGARDQAITAVRLASSLAPGVAAYHAKLADMLWQTDQYYQAINEWTAAVAAEPNDLGAHLALGHAYLKVGDRLSAVRHFQRALEIDPANTDARRALGRR